jgi:alkanesulfonate monooxygenase SsuD/methylene tetrahydromethanopterin reductase-like flavin-dependent oxidoreductase (luciferase family)
MLDLVSNGRVDFGSGESSSEAELGGFAIEYADKRDAWLEGLEVALRCMTETPFTGHEGPYASVPPRNVVPKPKQSPHPPLWVACSRRDTILMAAEKGMGALSFAFIDPEEAGRWMADYERTMAASCVPVGSAVNPNVACVTPMMLCDDESEALRRGLEGANFFGYSLAHYYVFGEHRPAETDVWDEFTHKRAAMGYSPETELALQQERLGAKVAAGEADAGLRGAIGTPEQVRDFLRRYEDAGVDQIIFVLQAGRNRHEHIMESLERFGTEILPEFAERDGAAQEAKARRYEPIVEAAMGRKEAWLAENPRPSLPDDYVMKAIPKQMVDQARNEVGKQFLDKIAEESAEGRSDTMSNLLG